VSHDHSARPLAPLALAALSVVFGDIGTSPLYTLTTCSSLSGASAARLEDVLGIASLLVWVLVVVVCLPVAGDPIALDQHADCDGKRQPDIAMILLTQEIHVMAPSARKGRERAPGPSEATEDRYR
jgi:K+ potassium transporter